MTAAIIATGLCALWALATFWENEQHRRDAGQMQRAKLRYRAHWLITRDRRAAGRQTLP